ncbi:MAG TPA: diacylglycerol kinase family protein [Ktedonobacteraceae bacterium]|nr:diacylglycerol kinase family protein [Ktedonobacteraceae bacterium]
MSGKKAYLVINPRAGQNFTHITGVLAVLGAAGWRTRMAIKEYGDHGIALAKKAVEKGHDLIIAYGGDGTLCQVINGVMNVKDQQCTVGLIPGGTANVWANEVGIPTDPIKAVLTLVGSEFRRVDIGHIEVSSLAVSDKAQETQSGENDRSDKDAKHYFMLMSGLGIDATVMSRVSKPLKYRLGSVAVGLSAAREVPVHQSFPVEIEMDGAEDNAGTRLKGEVMQIVIGNTRRYADVVEITPNAYIDDGLLNACLITAGTPLTTMQLAASLLFRRRPDNMTAEYITSAHFSLKAPASINLQLDGSAVQLKDYLSKATRRALQHALEPREMMVTYRIDVLPRALRVAIPQAYDNTLFEHNSALPAVEDQRVKGKEQAVDAGEAAQFFPDQIKRMLEDGRKVTVIGAIQLADEKDVYVLAGTVHRARTSENRPVAVRIDATTIIVKQNGRSLPPAALLKLHEGSTLVVEGKKNKRGVIRAERVVI